MFLYILTKKEIIEINTIFTITNDGTFSKTISNLHTFKI